MALDLDGLATLKGMAAHPTAFPGIESEATKIARALLTKLLKDRATTLSMVRAMASALPEGTLAHVTDAMTDSEVAALATRLDRLNPAAKGAERHAKAMLIGALISGAAEPMTRTPAREKAPGPAPAARKKASSGIEAARKVLQSKAMGARKVATTASKS